VSTWLDDIPPWPKVQAFESVIVVHMDQCMTGAVDDLGNPVKKPTEWMASHETLLRPFDKLICPGTGIGGHVHGSPTGKALERLKEYSYKVCNHVVDGIEALKKEVGRTKHAYVFN
jgi:hypothetical protein